MMRVLLSVIVTGFYHHKGTRNVGEEWAVLHSWTVYHHKGTGNVRKMSGKRVLSSTVVQLYESV